MDTREHPERPRRLSRIREEAVGRSKKQFRGKAYCTEEEREPIQAQA